MKFLVTASAFDPKTGKKLGGPRDEIIDTETNQLFKSMITILDIHDRYEEFWNHLNKYPRELVFVEKIKKIK